MIILKHIASVSARLQPYKLTIKYRPGKLVDAFSRDTSFSQLTPIPYNINLINVTPSSETILIVAKKNDDELHTRLTDIIHTGWPNDHEYN